MTNKNKKQYVCGTCGEVLVKKGDGLGTFTCRTHPKRIVTVSRDNSGGKEADRSHRNEPVSQTRHTLVRVKYVNEKRDNENQ